MLAGLFAEGVCKGCRGPLDDAGPHLCRKCAELAEQLVREDAAKANASQEGERRQYVAVRSTGMPKGFGDVRFNDDLKPRVSRPEAIQRAQRAIGQTMVTIQGLAGSGKTSLAAAMFGAIMDAAAAGDPAMLALASSALWTSAIALARARREHPIGQGDAPLVIEARTASLLVIDDLAMERDGDTVGGVLYERQCEGLPTIVTTGAGLKDLKLKYGDGIARRITEQGQTTLIRADNPTAPATTAAPWEIP